MAVIHVYCPQCSSDNVVKFGLSEQGKHLNLRTRLKRLTRKTICFSTSDDMHDTVIGLFINRYEFGMDI